MKNRITRLMAMMLTLATVFTLFAVPASAANDNVNKFECPSGDWNKPNVIIDGEVITLADTAYFADSWKTEVQNEVLSDADYTAMRYYLKDPGFAIDLDKLAPYMPQASAAIKNRIDAMPGYTWRGQTLYAYVDKNAAQPYIERNTALKTEACQYLDPKYERNDYTNLVKYLQPTLEEYKHQETDLMLRGQLFRTSAGTIPTCAPAEWANDVFCQGVKPMYVSGAGQNDKLVHHAMFGGWTFYYGANMFRNSALETVLFAPTTLSDHWVSATGAGSATKRVYAGLFLGREAISFGDHAFADNANLKSVIFPTEPARLYFEDGVFSNCPDLTVYAPAGGYIEGYCKANGIKFQAIAHGFIEPKVDSVPTVRVFDHYESETDDLDIQYCKRMGLSLEGVTLNTTHYGYFGYKPVNSYATDFTNAFAVTYDTKLMLEIYKDDLWNKGVFVLLPPTEYHDSLVSDLNRYRADRDGQFTLGHPLIDSQSLGRLNCGT